MRSSPTWASRAGDGDGETQSRRYSPPRLGSTRGWEIMQADFFEEQAARMVRELNETLAAPKCPSDVRSVILMPDIMYLAGA